MPQTALSENDTVYTPNCIFLGKMRINQKNGVGSLKTFRAIVDHHFHHKRASLGIDVMVDHQFVVTEWPCSP